MKRPPLASSSCLALALALALTGCGDPSPGPTATTTESGTGPGSATGTETATATATATATETETETATETATETETGTEAIEVSVKWIEVAASDYKLELQPKFDPAITRYTALADGPRISVYVDVIVDADVDAVVVNDVPAGLIGFRTWRSAPETGLVSPTFAMVEVELAGAEVPTYAIDIVTP